MRVTRVISLSITLAAASLLAQAQTFNEVQVNLPYAITAGNAVVPAGNYEIRPLADQPDTFGFYKDGVECKTIVHATHIKSAADVDTRIVLRGGGEHLRLSELWIDGDTGYQFTTPSAVKTQGRESSPPLVIKARRS